MKNMDAGLLVQDIKDRPVALISNEWQLRWVMERNPEIEFLIVPEDARQA
jgi:peptide chain release factor 3